MGPQIILDKSAFQSLSRDESLRLSFYYFKVITPILFMEVLADLKKYSSDLQPSLDEVRKLAGKFWGGDEVINEHAEILIAQNLMGAKFEMDGRAVLRQPQYFRGPDGKLGAFYDEEPERKALRQWQEGRLDEFQLALAERWRSAVQEIDLEDTHRRVRSLMGGEISECDLPKILEIATFFCEARGRTFQGLKAMLVVLKIPPKHHQAVISRWKEVGKPSLRDFAPYAWHCFRVNVFFVIALGAGKVKPRRTNRIDMQYLYYLPFCKVFSSKDRFHEDVVTLFLRADQDFVHADKLKDDLAAIDEFWRSVDAGTTKDAEWNYRHFPPPLEGSITCKLWDKHAPGWRDRAKEPEVEITPERNEAIMKRLKPMLDAVENLDKDDSPNADLRTYTLTRP